MNKGSSEITKLFLDQNCFVSGWMDCSSFHIEKLKMLIFNQGMKSQYCSALVTDLAVTDAYAHGLRGACAGTQSQSCQRHLSVCISTCSSSLQVAIAC